MDTKETSHSSSSPSILESAVDSICGVSHAGQNYHSSTVSDGNGNSATGHGYSAGDARADAESKL